MPADPNTFRSKHGSLIGRVLILAAIFAGVLGLTAHLVTAHEVRRGTPEYAVRLAGWMTGLFAGGIAASLAGLAMLLGAKRPGEPSR